MRCVQVFPSKCPRNIVVRCFSRTIDLAANPRTPRIYREVSGFYEGEVERVAAEATLYYANNRPKIRPEIWPIEMARAAKRRRLEPSFSRLKFLEGSNEEVLSFEIDELTKRFDLKAAKNGLRTESEGRKNVATKDRFGEEIELDVVEMSSTGEGLAVSQDKDQLFLVPFAYPGDIVLARITNKRRGLGLTNADFLRVVKPSPKREDQGIGCKYFATCSGCQLQMLPYQDQLDHKRMIVQKAYQHFSDLEPSLIPEIGATMGSPLRYGYRTKLTPHFDGNRKHKDKKTGRWIMEPFKTVPPIGFTKKGFRSVMDIEQCPIGTDIINQGMTAERKRVKDQLATFNNGATLILRESTNRTAKPSSSGSEVNTNGKYKEQETESSQEQSGNKIDQPDYIEEKSCIVNNNDFSTEYIDDWKFTNRAGSFFQNNNSILSTFTTYIRENAIPQSTSASSTTVTKGDTKTPNSKPIQYLLDAYCGSGLFAITLSSLFTKTLGIDIDPAGIVAARQNAKDNKLQNCGFIEASAEHIFADVPFPAEQTCLVIDPPRKGCSLDFLEQMMKFAPKRVVYVSCNVHSQARDVGFLVRGKEVEGRKVSYKIEKLRGFDFFPQTGHVEGVCFLDRVET